MSGSNLVNAGYRLWRCLSYRPELANPVMDRGNLSTSQAFKPEVKNSFTPIHSIINILQLEDTRSVLSCRYLSRPFQQPRRFIA